MDIENIKNLLVGFGFNEMISYSFVSEKEYDIFQMDKETDGRKLIKILNPLGEDLAVMRTSLLPSVVRAVAYNLNRKNNEGRLFELAKIYSADNIPLEKLPVENNVLSLAAFGEGEDFFSIKGVVEGVLDTFAYGAHIKYERSNLKAMHPTRSADIIIDGEKIGYFGQLNPVIAEKLGIEKPVYVGEIYYDKLTCKFNNKIVFKPISKFPPVERDIAITVDEKISCDNVIACIKEVCDERLESVKLFDIYQGAQVEKGKKSMAFNLIFLSTERTLSVEEIDELMSKILNNLSNKINAELR
jgi:phenylalanyl-tRNA synthetase beta chain